MNTGIGYRNSRLNNLKPDVMDWGTVPTTLIAPGINNGFAAVSRSEAVLKTGSRFYPDHVPSCCVRLQR
ncbi:hypothetical protein ABH944_006403 [Caballeronia udeis]|jgi:hypothetical protein|uniref:Uncharacterized protein n=1 Tax=Caballeronia udeis TaxID=1232866 RepID=A0ABW8MUB9_9BURK